LPEVVAALRQQFPKVNISLHQAAPEQVARMLIDEVAEIGIATESLADFADLVTLPCYAWQHTLVLPHDHKLARQAEISLEDVAREPLITYHPSFTGRTKIDAAFAAAKLSPRIALEAIDSDVIKTYTKLGLGIGIAAEMAVRDIVSEGPSSGLVVRPAGYLFGTNTARLAFKRSAYLRNFVYTFAELLSPRLTREVVERSMNGFVRDDDV
jgi:LysR family cys regulon transcriptional activator